MDLFRSAMRRALCGAIVFGVTAASAWSGDAGSAYPTRPVRILAGSPAADSDLMARLVAQRLAERWGQQFVVDNRGAAGGTIGTAIGARALPDGYTLTVGHVGTHASAAFLYRNLAYDPVKDFAPITQLSSAPIVVVAHPSVTAPTLKDLVVQARGDDLTFGSAGGGTASHLSGELLIVQTGLKLRHVPYKGATPALTAVLSGETRLSFLSLATVLPQIRSGKLRAIAVMSPKRFAAAQDIATAAESGYPALHSIVWMGLFAPAGTPPAIVAQLHKEVTTMLATPEIRDSWLARGAELTPTTPEQFGAFVRDEVAKWGKVVRSAGVRVD